MKLIEDQDGIRLRVLVKPGARKDVVLGIHGDALKVSVTSPPVRGAANRGLREYLAKRLGIAPSHIEILSGSASRLKTLRIAGISRDRVESLLLRDNPARENQERNRKPGSKRTGDRRPKTEGKRQGSGARRQRPEARRGSRGVAGAMPEA